MMFLQLPALRDDNALLRGAGLASIALHLFHDVHTVNDGTEDDVLAVQPEIKREVEMLMSYENESG